jgi:hypothetical protein
MGARSQKASYKFHIYSLILDRTFHTHQLELFDLPSDGLQKVCMKPRMQQSLLILKVHRANSLSINPHQENCAFCATWSWQVG